MISALFIVLDIDECASSVKECNDGLEENCTGNNTPLSNKVDKKIVNFKLVFNTCDVPILISIF